MNAIQFRKVATLLLYLFAEEVAADDGVAIAGHQLRLAFRTRETFHVVHAARPRQGAHRPTSAAYRVTVALRRAAAPTAANAAWRLVVGSGTSPSDPHDQLVGRDSLPAGRTRSRTPE